MLKTVIIVINVMINRDQNNIKWRALKLCFLLIRLDRVNSW